VNRPDSNLREMSNNNNGTSNIDPQVKAYIDDACQKTITILVEKIVVSANLNKPTGPELKDNLAITNRQKKT
ncbi:18598_t:CDS:2, partial [Dentiscutata erythropus]